MASPAAAAIPSVSNPVVFDWDSDETECASRLDRMARIVLPVQGRPYSRADFIKHINNTVGLPALEAIGPTHRSEVWEMTFSTTEAKSQFLAAGDFTLRDGAYKASVGGMRQKRHFIRILWYADCMPLSYVVNIVKSSGPHRVLTARRNHAVNDGIRHARANECTIIVESDAIDKIPYTVEYTVNGEHRMSMLIVPGRPELCLRCRQTGHVRRDCTAPFCRVCRVAGHEPGPECTRRTWATRAARRPDERPEDSAPDVRDSVHPATEGDLATQSDVFPRSPPSSPSRGLKAPTPSALRAATTVDSGHQLTSLGRLPTGPAALSDDQFPSLPVAVTNP
jgi:hypothetical protein